MTIRDFARLCGCNPQTLRYYDRVDLLKPVKVDRWSGYRYYGEEQALTYVKIKNLQRAGFTIEEIKGLLDQDDRMICRAFDVKIAEAEERLAEIRAIRESYRTEMDLIQKKISEMREKVTRAMQEYDPTEEFGIGAKQYASIIGNVELFFENMAALDPKTVKYEELDDAALSEEEKEHLDRLNDPDYEIIYEKHGWERVKDFFDELGELEDGAEYALCLQVDHTKGVYDMAFGNTLLGIMLAKDPEKERNLSVSIGDSQDGRNHFWFLKKKMTPSNQK